jgi:hypothetical protein
VKGRKATQWKPNKLDPDAISDFAVTSAKRAQVRYSLERRAAHLDLS